MHQPKRPADHALAVIKAAVNAVPVVGGVIGSLISDYVPTATERATEKAMEFLEEKLTALGARIDAEAVNKDEFSELFKSCYLIIVRTHQEEKLHASANILANLLLRRGDPSKVSYEELDHLVRCVDALSIGAISILGAARDVASERPLSPQKEIFQFAQLRARVSLEPSLLMSLVSELRGLNLVRVQESPIRQQGDAEYDGFHMGLTPIGARFVERFIEGRMDVVAGLSQTT